MAKVYPRFLCEAGCGRSIPDYPGRKTRKCRSCFGRAMTLSDAHKQACAAAMARRWIDPVEGPKLRASVRAANQRPERREHLLQLGLINGPKQARYVNTPSGSPQRRLANRRMVDSKLAWCPREYRPMYAYLRKVKEIPAPEAKRMVLAQIDYDLQVHARTGALPQSERLEQAA